MECEALECLWILWIPKCDFNTGPCTKRCSKKFLKFKISPARVIACWGFCKEFDVALPFFRVIAEPLFMAAIHQYVGLLVIVL